MALPEKFKCVLADWDGIYSLCDDLAEKVRRKYEPDVIVGLARGGWFPSRILCDLLGISDLVSLKIEHYLGTGLASGKPEIKYPLSENAVRGKRVLVVDDICDSGKSLMASIDYVKSFGPKDAKTGALQVIYTSKYTPDYYSQYLKEWAWIVYPWNFVEDLTTLSERIIGKEGGAWSVSGILDRLQANYGIRPSEKRMEEVLSEMVRRKKLTLSGSKWVLKK